MIEYQLNPSHTAIKSLILFLCLFFPCSADLSQDLLLAQAFYETGDYHQARQLYEKLLEENLPSWQRNKILYNIATALLAEKQFDEALKRYQQISTEQDLSPLLSKRLQQNVAWIYLLRAMDQAAIVQENPDASIEDYRKGIFLFRQTMNAIQEAQKTACELSLVKGNTECQPERLLEDMNESAKVQYTLFLQNFENFRLRYVDIREGIPLLLSIVNNAQDDLTFLQNENLSEKMKEHYLQYYLQLQNRRLSLWNLLKEKMKQDPAHAEERENFLKAESSFQEFIHQMEQKNFDQARQNLNQAIESLNSLMRVIFGDTPLSVILRKLLASYTIALLQDPLQQSALLGLQNEQRQFRSLLSSQDFSRVDANLSLALQALNQAKTTEARMFTEEAQHLIRQMIRQQEIPSENVPAVILERGIEDQESALALNRLKQEIKDLDANISKEASDLLRKSQSVVLQTVQSFTEEVIKQGRSEFEKAQDPQLQCQDTPWDEVLPLFDQGLQDARQAQNLLTEVPPRGRTAMPLQEKVLKSWHEALKLMREPKKKPKEKTKEPKESKETPATPQEEPMHPPGSEINQTLRLLQEMEQDDRSTPKLDVIPNKQEAKPW